MFKHQDTGNKQTNKSPHLPLGLWEEAIFGLNLNVLNLIILIIISKYKTQIKSNQNHHQYCHCIKCINTSAFVFTKDMLKLG